MIARFEASGVICMEAFKDHPQMGRFTLRDEGMSTCHVRFLSLFPSTLCFILAILRLQFIRQDGRHWQDSQDSRRDSRGGGVVLSDVCAYLYALNTKLEMACHGNIKSNKSHRLFDLLTGLMRKGEKVESQM